MAEGMQGVKILFLSDNFPPEGNAPATRLWEHATRWVNAGHEVTVITCAPNFPEGKLFEGYSNRWRQVEYLDGIRVVRVKTYITANEGFVKRTFDYVSFMLMGFLMGLLERRPDVVIATSPQFFSAVGGWALSVAKWRPFVFELRDLWPATILAVGAMKSTVVTRILERLEIFLYRRAAAIVAVTESFRQNLVSRGIEPAKIEVVRNGVDLEVFHPRPKSERLVNAHDLKGKFVCGYIGTHGLCHNLPRVLEGVKMLRDRQDIVFLFVGAGAERGRVEEIAAREGLDNVRLIARQPRHVMPEVWSVCDLALVSLSDDPVFSTVIPSKIFEAVGMGIPILASLPPGEATEIIRDSGVGICIRPEDPVELAESASDLADNNEKMKILRGNCIHRRKEYSRDRLAERMEQILSETVSAARG